MIQKTIFAAQAKKMTIRILITGGTFDKEYNMITGKLYFKDTHLPEIFEIGRCNLDIKIRNLMMIDSLEMTASDRELILHNCRDAGEDHIIITHGTDTMAETAQLIADHQLEKVIVFTGAMIPYKFGASDAFFNLGSALAYVQCLPVGSYLCMHGRYFPAYNVKKNKDTGFFEAIS